LKWKTCSMKSSAICKSIVSTSSSSCSLGSTSLTSSWRRFLSRTSFESGCCWLPDPAAIRFWLDPPMEEYPEPPTFPPPTGLIIADPLLTDIDGGGVGPELWCCIGDGELPGMPLILRIDKVFLKFSQIFLQIFRWSVRFFLFNNKLSM